MSLEVQNKVNMVQCQEDSPLSTGLHLQHSGTACDGTVMDVGSRPTNVDHCAELVRLCHYLVLYAMDADKYAVFVVHRAVARST